MQELSDHLPVRIPETKKYSDLHFWEASVMLQSFRQSDIPPLLHCARIPPQLPAPGYTGQFQRSCHPESFCHWNIPVPLLFLHLPVIDRHFMLEDYRLVHIDRNSIFQATVFLDSINIPTGRNRDIIPAGYIKLHLIEVFRP